MELLLHRENFLYHSRLQEEIRCGTMKKMRGGRRMFFWMDTLFPIFLYRTTLIISKKPGNTGISRDIRTEFTTDLLLSD